MPMSLIAKKVYDLAKAYDDKLRADDPRFDQIALVMHDDGTVHLVQSAFVMCFRDEHGQEWFVLFAEHEEPRVFPADEVRHACCFGVAEVEALLPELWPPPRDEHELAGAPAELEEE